MPDTTVEDTEARSDGAVLRLDPLRAEVNTGLVLVVGSSGICRVVVSRIVERAGLRAVSVEPGKAQDALATYRPGMVVLDGGADNRECDPLYPGLVNRRTVLSGNLPFVVFVSNRNVAAESLAHRRAIDAVVTKPITPDSLQPVIRRLIDTVRG